MTITFNDTDTQYQFSVNGEFATANRIVFKSEYSNRNLFDVSCSVLQSNARYTQLQFNTDPPLGNTHQNGIYTYEVYATDDLLVSGVVKVITNPGGGTGTTPYISDNENREGEVYFRPSY